MKIDRDELYVLGLDELVDEICELKQQLQAYKDKEDKLREYIRKQQVIFNDYDVVVDTQLNNILQILNEGSDK